MSHESRSARILVVDDDLIARKLLEANLQKHGYEVVLADCVVEAQRRVDQHGIGGFDAVVTDYRMPGLTGLDLLAWLRERDASLATIMITAESERQLVADSLRSGVQDFLDKPLNIPQLVAALARAVDTTRRQRQLNAAERAVREIASVQHTLLQMHADCIGDRLDVCFHPQQNAGGDFLGVFPVEPGRFVVLATDVSGHDLKAAFIASHFQGIMRGMLERRTAIAEVFRFFNDFLVNQWNWPGNWGQYSFTETSVAACAVEVDLNARTVAVLNSGFPLPSFFGTNHRLKTLLDEGTAPLGWFPSLETNPQVHAIDELSTVYLWSDGLDDLAALLGVDPMAVVTCLRSAKLKGGPVPKILDQAKDDILAVWLNVGTDIESDTLPFVVVCQRYAGHQVSQIDALQQTWERSLRLAIPGIQEGLLHDVLLCLREGVSNALFHGCGASADQSATVQINWSPATGVVRAHIQDPGPGHSFDFEAHEARAETELVLEHRGLILMKHLSRNFQSERNGSSLQLEFSAD